MASKRTTSDPEATSAEAATADELKSRVEATDAGPVLHVPTTIEESTEEGAREAQAVQDATGADDEEKPEYTRVLAWDGPLNVNDRNAFDPPKPDIVSTTAGAVVERKG